MITTWLVILFLVLITYIGLNLWAQKHEQNVQMRKHLFLQYKTQIQNTLETLADLKAMGANPVVIDLLTEYSMTLFGKMRSVSTDPGLLENLSSDKASTVSTSSDKGYPPKTSAAINRMAKHIRYARGALKRCQGMGKVTPQKVAVYDKELRWLRLRLVVDAHIFEGKRLGKSNDVIGAQAHFMKAKKTLNQSGLYVEEKAQKSKELELLLKPGFDKQTEAIIRE